MEAVDTVDRTRGETERFLRLLANPESASIPAADVAVIVAHPDDETLGCGAQLRRLKGATVVVVTDGAPRDLMDVRNCDFPDARAYAAARRRELADAMALAGVADNAIRQLGIADQDAVYRLTEIVPVLKEILLSRNIGAVLTHTYEGGHPDHDATAFAVHSAVGLMRRAGHEVSIIEMPFYFSDPSGLIVQRFSSVPGCPEVTIPLMEVDRMAKRQMIAAHKTQAETLALFALDAERFRRAPIYDFTKPPPGRDGRWYTEVTFGMTGARWLSLAGQALNDLNLREASRV
jgi:LmbE family N-acetylglucosaminyl deacetylase